MSLINEALKKAQHQRTGSGLDAPPMPGGGSGGSRGPSGMPTGTLVLLIAGAAVVVVISVVATVYFVNRPSAPKVAATAPVVTAPVSVPVSAPAAPTTSPIVSTSSPVIIAPVIIKAPVPVVEKPVTPPPAVEQPAPATAAVTPPPPAPVPIPAPAAEPTAEGSLADRIANYVDKVRVTGIRTSETGSKVLMNDKVYRLNDLVDRKLGLRLVKIEADSLTFADATGATYVKSF